MPTHFGIEARAILRAFGRSAEAESRYDSLANHNDPWKTIFRGRFMVSSMAAISCYLFAFYV